MLVYGEIFEQIDRYTRLDVDIYNGPLSMLKENNYLTDEEVNLITSEPNRVRRFDILSKIVIERYEMGIFQCFKHSLLRHYPWIVDQIDEAFILCKIYWYHMLKTMGTSLFKMEVPSLRNIAWTNVLNTYLAYLYDGDGGNEQIRMNLNVVKHLMRLDRRTTVSFYHLQPETLKLEMETWDNAPLPEVLKLINEGKYKIVKFTDEAKERGGHDDNLREFMKLVNKYTPHCDRVRYEKSFRTSAVMFVNTV